MNKHSYNTRGANDDESKNLTESEFIISALKSSFDESLTELKTGIINVKDVIIKNLLDDNKKLRESNDKLKTKIINLESDLNDLNQYGRRNNLEISGIPEDVKIDDLEKKAVEILNAIDIKIDMKQIEGKDIEGCHHVGKFSNNKPPRKTLVRFVNRKICLQALINRRKLRSFDTSTIGLDNTELYFNENLTPLNNKLAYLCRKLKKDKIIEKTNTRNGEVILFKFNSDEGLKVPNESFSREMFPSYNFGTTYDSIV